jgi:hypothetical protein
MGAPIDRIIANNDRAIAQPTTGTGAVQSACHSQLARKRLINLGLRSLLSMWAAGFFASFGHQATLKDLTDAPGNYIEGKSSQVRGQIPTLDLGATPRYSGDARGRAVGNDVGFESQAIAVSTTGGRENVAPVCVSAILVSLRWKCAGVSSVRTAGVGFRVFAASWIDRCDPCRITARPG